MRIRPAVVVVVLLSSIFAVGPTARAAEESTPPPCAPDGTALAIAASGKQFDKDCLAAPADQEFTITFDNRDTATRHNVSIYDTSAGDKALFKGTMTVGPSTITYSVPAQAAGTYEFRCDPHDETMLGTFVVS